MIHTLEISPEMSLKEIKKLARRYAMTGGYEVLLAEGLKTVDLFKLFETHAEELKLYSPKSSTYRSNNSYRVLALIKKHPLVTRELISKLNDII